MEVIDVEKGERECVCAPQIPSNDLVSFSNGKVHVDVQSSF